MEKQGQAERSQLEHNCFLKLFEVDGGSGNKKFQVWKKIATAFNISPIPKSVEIIKSKINKIIEDLEWRDIEKIKSLEARKGQRKRKSEKQELIGMEERLVGLEEIMKDVLSQISAKGKVEVFGRGTSFQTGA